MEVLRQASPLERAYIDGNVAIYFYFTLDDHFKQKAFEHAVAIVLRRHPFLRSALNDDVFIEKDVISPTDHITQIVELPTNGEQFSYALDSSSLFHLYVAPQEDLSTDCLLVLHHAIADVTSGIALIEDLVRGLVSPEIPQTSLPVHTSIETFFPYCPTQPEIESYASSFHNSRAYPATCVLPVTEPAVPFEQTSLIEKEVVLRKDLFDRLKTAAKKNKVSRHALLTSILLHAIPDHIERTSVCVGTVVDMKRRLLEGRSCRDLFSGPLISTSFIDLNGQDPAWTTAEKYAGALAAKIESPDIYRENYGIISEKVNLFLLGVSFFISDAGTIRFSNAAVQELVTHLSFSSPLRLNCPYIMTTTYGNTVTLRIGHPTPWISEKTIDQYINRISENLNQI